VQRPSLSIVPFSTIWVRRKAQQKPFDKGEKARGKDTRIVNNDPVLKKLEPQTERNYQKNLDLWN
jgi:hypothetical protein